MMFHLTHRSWAAALAMSAAALAGPSAYAEQTPADPFAEPGSRLSGTLSFDYYTHFVSYGYDVWDAGNAFGSKSTFNPAASLNIALTENLNLFTGVWGDVNDNSSSPLGGQVQEVDTWFGFNYALDKFTFSVTYQFWNFSSTTEHVLDLGVAFDDSEYLGDWALKPNLTVHRTSDPQNGTDSGWAYVLGLAPGCTINEEGDYPVTLTLPVKFGFGDGDFYYDAGFAYASVGAQASIPLAFIDESFGAWSLNFGLTYYLTDDDAIPQDALYLGDNPDDNYLVGNIGVALAF